jgi:hypothetical protein
MAAGLSAVVEGGEGVETARGIVAAHQCPARWGVEGVREAGEVASGCGGRPRLGRKGGGGAGGR